jgi:8-oxo-dGTP diphosphatase
MVSRPEVCVGAIVVDGGRLLLIRRGRGAAIGSWSVPGGRVEQGETVREAVVRELREETGLDGECDRFVGWVERIGVGYHYVILDFIVRVEPAEGVAGDDATDVRWVPVDDVANWPQVVPGLVDFLTEHGVLPA